MPKETLEEIIREQVVNDYFTPNIKAEVVLDTLLTPYIPQILKNQLDTDAVLLTKEMSLEEIPEDGQKPNDDRGSKIDYLLEGECVYLVELKTSVGSIDIEQAKRYLNNCCDPTGSPKTFGDVFGNKLLRIIHKKYKDIPCDPQELEDSFQTVVGCTGKYAEHAKHFLKAKGLASTYKYLYTVGQLMDNHSGEMLTLWKKPLQLVYLTPDGDRVFPAEPSKKDKQEQDKAMQEWEELRKKWKKLYIAPGDINSSASLKASVSGLRDTGDDLARFLADIITEIYGG